MTPLLGTDGLRAECGPSGITPEVFRRARASAVAFAHDSGLGQNGDRRGPERSLASSISVFLGRLKFLDDQFGMDRPFAGHSGPPYPDSHPLLLLPLRLPLLPRYCPLLPGRFRERGRKRMMRKAECHLYPWFARTSEFPIHAGLFPSSLCWYSRFFYSGS